MPDLNRPMTYREFVESMKQYDDLTEDQFKELLTH